MMVECLSIIMWCCPNNKSHRISVSCLLGGWSSGFIYQLLTVCDSYVKSATKNESCVPTWDIRESCVYVWVHVIGIYSKHSMWNLCWFNAGSASQTVAQYWTSTDSTRSVTIIWIHIKHYLRSVLVQCWASIADRGPTLNQHRFNIVGISRRHDKYVVLMLGESPNSVALGGSAFNLHRINISGLLYSLDQPRLLL